MHGEQKRFADSYRRGIDKNCISLACSHVRCSFRFSGAVAFCPELEPLAAMQPKNNADNLGNVADIGVHNAARAGQHGAVEIVAGAIRTTDERPGLGNGGACFWPWCSIPLLLLLEEYYAIWPKAICRNKVPRKPSRSSLDGRLSWGISQDSPAHPTAATDRLCPQGTGKTVSLRVLIANRTAERFRTT